MKKLISILIACILAMSSVITGFAVYADEKNESKEINNFIDGVVELTQEYDKGKEFVAPEENETAQIQPFSAQNSEEVTDSTEPEYTLQDFQTARLIVRADGKFNTYGALEDVSGFEDYHILQYDSPEAAMSAYYKLQSGKDVFNVAPDLVVYGLQGDNSKILTQEELDNSAYLCDWSHDRTQSDRLLDYLKTQEIPNREVIVAVIDSGIDYNHEIFEGRVEYSKFNSSTDGKPDDEFDGAEESHGTAVSSVIVDNTPENVKVSVYKVNLPKLLSVPNNAFSNGHNSNFRPRIYILDSVKTIGENAFGQQYTTRAEFSHLETAESLPQTEECIISMPSTFRECTEDTIGRNYKVYGTKGTYAEQWANENGHEFIEISQDTAVLTPLPEKYTDADGVLTADVIGFNRTYQWYANDTNDNTTGTPIPNATGKEFNPADYPAKYYYCVVTSTDVGFDPIEIRTNVTENTTYQSADYTEYNKAVEQAKAIDRSLYQDLTALDEALSVDVSNLSVKDQALVDAQTAAIINAINSLVYKPADYTEYNKAVEQAKSLNRDDYVDFSKVDEALAVDVSGKNITEQDVVDKQTKAILEAIDSLTEKEKPTEPPVTEPEEPTVPPTEPDEPTTEPNTSVDADTPSIPNTGTKESISCAAASLLLLSVCAYFIGRKKHSPQ